MAIVARPDDSDFSPTWKWADDEELAGGHVEFRRASTDNGDKIIWEINSDEHGPVSVWLDPTNLVAKVRGELARRKEKLGEPRIEIGERIRLNPGTKRPSKRTPGQTVWPFPTVEFENAVPDTSAEELLVSGVESKPDGGEALNEAAGGADTNDEPPPAAAANDEPKEGVDDDIPF